jgi:hypothetical protein
MHVDELRSDAGLHIIRGRPHGSEQCNAFATCVIGAEYYRLSGASETNEPQMCNLHIGEFRDSGFARFTRGPA